ncbi:hypothetical protein COBT_003262 [Conglomerata obtusa]
MIYNSDTDRMLIKEKVIENQVCRGYFKPNGGQNCTYNIKIVKEIKLNTTTKPKAIYIDNKLPDGEESWFSFNIIHPETLSLYMEPVAIEDGLLFKPGKLEFLFETDYDTFSDEAIRKKVLQPATAALKYIMGVTEDLMLKTDAKIEKFKEVHMQHEKSMRVAIFCSCLAINVILLANIIEFYKMRKFFKQKKVI